MSARSTAAAMSFLAVSAVLSPPVHEAIAAFRNVLAPARVAFLTSALLVPIGLGAFGLDWVAALDVEARNRGFASAAQWRRAQDLGVSTPQALAAHDEAQRNAAREKLCAAHPARPPLDCYEPSHQKAALAFAGLHLAGDKLEIALREAIAQQRKAWLAIDSDCAGLLDAIEEDALPVMIGSRADGIAEAAAIWARRLPREDLDKLSERAKAGKSAVVTRDTHEFEQRFATIAPVVEKEFHAVLQRSALQIVRSQPSWRSFLKGRTPVPECKPAAQFRH